MKKLIILEGPDGGGKTTFGRMLTTSGVLPGARLDHHSSYKGEHDIWKHYFDSLLFAVNNDCDVIMDRSWLSEPIYGLVYRSAPSRVMKWQEHVLETLAAKCCDTLIVWCLPPFDECKKAFNARREEEMLDDEMQLGRVYGQYASLNQAYCGQEYHGIKTDRYDRTRPEQLGAIIEKINRGNFNA